MDRPTWTVLMLASRVAVRRLRTTRFIRSRVLLHRVLVAHGCGRTLSFLDGKAMAVGECTTDPDARNGVVTTGRFRKGYKLHARANDAGIIEEYRVTALNEGEAKIARKLVRGDRTQAGVVPRAAQGRGEGRADAAKHARVSTPGREALAKASAARRTRDVGQVHRRTHLRPPLWLRRRTRPTARVGPKTPPSPPLARRQNRRLPRTHHRKESHRTDGINAKRSTGGLSASAGWSTG